jgi:hypothetical protein
VLRCVTCPPVNSAKVYQKWNLASPTNGIIYPQNGWCLSEIFHYFGSHFENINKLNLRKYYCIIDLLINSHNQTLASSHLFVNRNGGSLHTSNPSAPRLREHITALLVGIVIGCRTFPQLLDRKSSSVCQAVRPAARGQLQHNMHTTCKLKRHYVMLQNAAKQPDWPRSIHRLKTSWCHCISWQNTANCAYYL